MFALLPSANMNSLMNGTQSGKTFILLYLIIVLSAIVLLNTLFFNKTRCFRINILDVLLLIWCLYVILNCYIQGVSFSLRLGEFYGLIFLYLVIRQINSQYFIWLYISLVLGGVIQAIYGNLQLWGYFPSHHGIFKMTGSFYNPGPYAGYLAAVFPIALGLYIYGISIKFPKRNPVVLKLGSFYNLVKSNLVRKISIAHFFYNNKWEKSPSEEQKGSIRFSDYITIKSFFLISIISICLVLPASRSRAAWLAVFVSSFYLLAAKYKLLSQITSYFNTRIKQLSLISSLVIILTISGAYLYHMKKSSADGRLLIWKVTLSMNKDKPFVGYGFDQFKAHYMDYQSTYFEQNQDSEEAMVAGDNNYAFNELLQQSAENGIVGILLLVVIVVFIFLGKCSTPELNELMSEPIPIEQETNEKISLPLQYGKMPNGKVEQDWAFLHISRAVILSVLVFGMFSYPLQILPIKICLVAALAISAGVFSRKENINFQIPIHLNRSLRFTIKSIVSIGFLGLLWIAIIQVKLVETAYSNWKNAFDLYNFGIYADCLEDYGKAYPQLKTNGDFLTNYGKALSMAEKHAEAVAILQQAAKYYPNIIVYTALGDSYKKLEQTDLAEESYLHAWHMNPSRFYPLYLLAKLYDETGQKEKANEVAKELLEKDIKIESTAIEEIKEEMRTIIEKSESGLLNKNKTQTSNNLTPIYKGTKEEAYRSVALTGQFILQKW